jgi:hypothetical protein
MNMLELLGSDYPPGGSLFPSCRPISSVFAAISNERRQKTPSNRLLDERVVTAFAAQENSP